MKTFLNIKKWGIGLLGALILTVPTVGGAQQTISGHELWQQGKAELQEHLQPGQPVDEYRKKIEELGYQVTSTNSHTPSHVEYEVVKGEQTYEVQVNTDDKTHKATGVDIKMNLWKTRATKQALEQNKQTARTEAAPAPTAAIARRGNLYSDRDRTQTAQMVEELKALPIGQDKGFYQNELKTLGYEITRVNTDSQEELELEAVKKGQGIALNIDFDKTGRSTTIGASTLWAESESTTRTREEQMAGNGVEDEQEKSLAAHPNTEYRSGARQADDQARPSYADTSDTQ